jgi:hypothetical protein
MIREFEDLSIDNKFELNSARSDSERLSLIPKFISARF